MDPLTGVVLLVVAVAGFGGGLAVGGSPGAKALREQARALEAVTEQQRALAAEVARPIVIDAEVRAQLAGTPIQCVTAAGGDPMGPLCLLSTCWQHGASSAQRPECREVEKAALAWLAEQP